MDIVLSIHSLVRWVILAVAIVAIIKLGLGWLRGGAYDRVDRAVVMGYSGLLDLQALLGMVLLFVNGFLLGEGFPMPRILHTIVMVLAVVAGHLAGRGRDNQAVVRYRRSLAAIAGSLILIVVGIIIITAGQGS